MEAHPRSDYCINIRESKVTTLQGAATWRKAHRHTFAHILRFYPSYHSIPAFYCTLNTHIPTIVSYRSSSIMVLLYCLLFVFLCICPDCRQRRNRSAWDFAWLSINIPPRGCVKNTIKQTFIQQFSVDCFCYLLHALCTIKGWNVNSIPHHVVAYSSYILSVSIPVQIYTCSHSVSSHSRKNTMLVLVQWTVKRKLQTRGVER